MQLSRLPSTVETWYAGWGTSRDTWGDLILAHVRMVRPTTRLWFDTLMPLAAIMVLTNGQPDPARTFLFIVAMNLVHIAGTIVNDLQDAETDRRSSELLRSTRPIANRVIPRNLALVEAGLATVIAIALAWFISWKLAVVGSLLCVMIMLHELPPVRTQGRPILSQLAGILGLAGILLAIFLASGAPRFEPSLPFLVFVALYLGLAEMLVKDIRDMDNDAAAGKRTTAVRFGAGQATRMAMLAYGITGISWLWFAVSYSGLSLAPIAVATVVLVSWIIYTGIAARQLDRSFSKSLGRILHRGSVVVFSVLNLSVVVALLETAQME